MKFAFPHEKQHPDFNGMTLRDYFAAKAMQSFILNSDDVLSDQNGDYTDKIAEASYYMADRMILQRLNEEGI